MLSEMRRIGILSDTHGYLHPRLFDFFKDCDEIWHAGDIGSEEVLDKLESFKPTRAVWGNIDHHRLRLRLPEKQLFEMEGHTIAILHIAGRPGKYTHDARTIISEFQPSVLVGGHSHILQVKYDSSGHLLFINPGAAGINGFHQKLTMLRLSFNNKEISNLEVFEINRDKAFTEYGQPSE